MLESPCLYYLLGLLGFTPLQDLASSLPYWASVAAPDLVLLPFLQCSPAISLPFTSQKSLVPLCLLLISEAPEKRMWWPQAPPGGALWTLSGKAPGSQGSWGNRFPLSVTLPPPLLPYWASVVLLPHNHNPKGWGGVKVVRVGDWEHSSNHSSLPLPVGPLTQARSQSLPSQQLEASSPILSVSWSQWGDF